MFYELKPADKVDFGDYVNAFNHAYHGYYIPIILNRASLKAIIRRDSIDLKASVAAMDGERIIGIGMLAIREGIGWIGGIGVIPAYRRQGVARQMMQYLIHSASQRHLSHLHLEVFGQNSGAIQLYSSLGFQNERRLLILQRPPIPIQSILGYKTTQRDALYALSFYDQFHDVPNPWQRSHQALLDLAHHLQGWTIAADTAPDRVLGYGVGWLGNDGVHLMDIATRPTFNGRFVVGQALVSHIHQSTEENIGHLVNIGEDDAATASLMALGYETEMVQYEMGLTL